MNKEYDAETLRLLSSYGGRDPRVPQEVQVDALLEYDGSWSLDEFKELIDKAIASIPLVNRDSANVSLLGNDYGKLHITYTRLQNAEEVAAKVDYCLKHARHRQDEERAEYERLREKFK